MTRKSYPSDLSNLEWEMVQPLLPQSKNRGRKRETDQREIVNAILYLLNEGCKWRSLPHDFLHWSTVRTYFDRWRRKKVWYRLNHVLREKLRVKEGRKTKPSAAPSDARGIASVRKDD